MVQNEKNRFEYTLAQWLMSLREEKGLSQEALGIQLEKGQSDIAKIERGSKRVTVLELVTWMIALDIPYERIEEILKPIYNGMAARNKFWNNENGC